MNAEEIQAIYDRCQICGYDFRVALRTAARDGAPFYRTPQDTFEYQLTTLGS